MTGRLNVNIEKIAPSPQHERGDEEKNIGPKSRCNKHTRCNTKFQGASILFLLSLLGYNMNIGSRLAALVAIASVGVTFVLYSVLTRTSSTSSSITKGNNNKSASQSKVGLIILLDSARVYYGRGDYKKADIFFERVLEIEPNNIDALNGKGTSLYRLADYDKAKN